MFCNGAPKRLKVGPSGRRPYSRESPKARCRTLNISWYRRGLMEWNLAAMFPMPRNGALAAFPKIASRRLVSAACHVDQGSVGASSSLACRAFRSASFRSFWTIMMAWGEYHACRIRTAFCVGCDQDPMGPWSDKHMHESKLWVAKLFPWPSKI